MNKTRIFRASLISALLLAAGSAYSQTVLSLDSSVDEEGTISTEVLESTRNSYKVKVSIHGLTNDIVNHGDTEYHRLSFEGRAVSAEVGKPELPVFSQLIRIPAGSTYKAKVEEVKWTNLQVGRLMPYQAVSSQSTKQQFVIDNATYSSSQYESPILTQSNIMKWRDVENVALSVCPFKYYPASGKLSALSEFILQVDFAPSARKAEAAGQPDEEEDELHLFANSFEPMAAKAPRKILSSSTNRYDYLIITGNSSTISNSDAMKRFRKWKAFMGYRTKVVSTSTTGSTPEAIKSYITQEYSNGVRYVLFVGDTDVIPIKPLYFTVNGVSEIARSDYWYGCKDGDDDYQADIAIGRFSVSSLSDFENMVNKTLYYESTAISYAQKVLLVAHAGESDSMSECEDIRTESYSQSILFNRAYGAAPYSASNSDLMNYINNGMNIVFYSGHGGIGNWAQWSALGESFGSSQIASLDDSTCSIYLTSACNTGFINYVVPCMLENFMRSQHGAVAYIGSASTSTNLTGENYSYYFFKALYSQNTYRIGNLNIAASVFAISNTTSNQQARAKLDIYNYICGADPTLAIWTQVPQTIEDFNIEKYYGTINVWFGDANNPTSEELTLSIVTDDGEFYSGGHFSTIASANEPSGSYYMVISKHNSLPYIAYYGYGSNYIQNRTIDYNAYYPTTPLSIGSNVTTQEAQGDVTVEPGGLLRIYNGSGGVTIQNGFKCKLGGRLVVN